MISIAFILFTMGAVFTNLFGEKPGHGLNAWDLSGVFLITGGCISFATGIAIWLWRVAP